MSQKRPKTVRFWLRELVFVSDRKPRAALVRIVDDDEGVRHALALLIRAAGLDVASYPSSEAFLSHSDPARPGCLVLDVKMPGMTGLELQALLHERGEPLPIIVISGQGDIPMAVEAIKAGALDFVEKPLQIGKFLALVRRAIALDADLRAERASRLFAQDHLAHLTPREREVLQRLVAGKLNKVIAAELGISTRTVELHRFHIMHKLEAHSLSDLVRMALTDEQGSQAVP
jgi:FixJ family two-component response regulator